MIWTDEFVELDKAVHDRASFDCGEAELNNFIRNYAAKHMKARISKTMLLPASKPLSNGKYPICAFYTITPGSISRETLPASHKNKFPHYPANVSFIAQLAVHVNCQKQGLGKITLIKALEYLWDISNHHLPAYAVIVDCLNRNAEEFYIKYGFEVIPYNGARVRMFLSMQAIGIMFQ